MEPKGSLPRLQEPTTCPYSEPDQSSASPTPSHLLKIHFAYPSICAWVFHLCYIHFSDHMLLVTADWWIYPYYVISLSS